MATATAVLIPRAHLVHLFTRLGHADATGWSPSRLVRKVDEIIDEDTTTEDAAAKKTLTKIQEAMKADASIEVAEDATTSKNGKHEKAKDKKGPGAKAKPAKEKKPGTPSTKSKVWELWKKGKGITDPEEMHKAIKEAINLSTIRVWLKGWPKGEWLPREAKAK